MYELPNAVGVEQTLCRSEGKSAFAPLDGHHWK
jgi:hypothetical protein